MRAKLILGAATIVILGLIWVAVQFVFARPHGDCVTKVGSDPGVMQMICP